MVVAESFERIHRSNLIGMGILPIQFESGVGRSSLELGGDELLDIRFPDGIDEIKPRQKLVMRIVRSDGSVAVSYTHLTLLTNREV